MTQRPRTNVTIPDVNSSADRQRARDRSQERHQEEFDGSQPLDFPCHEAAAQHISTPKSLRQFKSDTDLAKHFKVTRMTVHRWKHEPDVMQRARWLSMTNKLAGELAVRIEWPEIMTKAVALAKSGNVTAMKFCQDVAWPKNLQGDKSISVESLVTMTGMDDAPEGEEQT